MILIAITIISIYALLIIRFFRGFDKVADFKIDNNLSPKTTFSVIIPFRNEENDLPSLLDSIEKLKYPKNLVEFIFIDDFSEDKSAAILNSFIAKNDVNCTLLKNIKTAFSPKKEAITLAINKSNNRWIITTDADCVLPSNWLLTFDNYIQLHDVNMIAGPVSYQIKNRFIEKFQLLDFLSLIGATIGGFGIKKPFLCNGANLCYQKNTFFELNGFDGNKTIASGDDIFLMEKFIQKNTEKVQYLKCFDSVVITTPQHSLKELFKQRIRWASKTTNYTNWFGKLVGLIVFVTNLAIILLILASLLNKISFAAVGILFLIKFNVDFMLLYKTATYFHQEKILKFYLYGSFIYPFFSVIVAILSLKKNYNWKGRHFKK